MKKLPPDFESDLQTIAERLYSNHAVVMVGAGFSRNASESYPDWNGLGDLFYALLHPGEAQPKGNYWNVMDLADEVAASKGRSELESIVQNRIGDGKLKPSALHERLLKLPWADVFTTNYDTLLEATLPSLLARRYSVVVTENQLAHAESPRIIKLHGSFPAIRPYVLTTEDYRCYPQTHAAFVNTVRQAFLEHTFCLIGFSGDDPNFLSWAGWLRDNLGDYSKPIYLVTMREPSESRRSLLARRNIRPVALEHFGEFCGDDFAGGYRCFFDYIDRCRKDPDRWFDSFHLFGDAGASLSLDKIVQKWERERGRYHGKLTVPVGQRELLALEATRSAPWLDAAKNLSDLNLATCFCYEFFWRLDLALRPAPQGLVEVAENVFYSWRKKLLHDKVDYDRSKLFFVAIQLMRVYRECGDWTKWEGVDRAIRVFVGNASGTVRDDYYYEVVLSALTRFNGEKAFNALKEWNPGDANPLALARAGMVYGKLNDWNEANRLLVNALAAVRKTSSYTNDRRSLQIESIVIRAWMITRMKAEENDFKPSGSWLRRDLHDRLNELRRYSCDIGDDLTYFESYFKIPPAEMFSSERHESFDLGPDQITHKFTQVLQDGYSFMRFCEIVALPIKCIDKESYPIALRSAVQVNAAQVLACLRYQASMELVKSVLTREALLLLPKEVAQTAERRILTDLRVLLKGGVSHDDFSTLDVLLQIASRLLCCDLATDIRRLAYDCLGLLFAGASRIPLQVNVQDYVRRLIRATPMDEMPEMISILAEMPPPVFMEHPLAASQFTNPVYFAFARVADEESQEEARSVFSGIVVPGDKWRKILSGLDDGVSLHRKWYFAIACFYDSLDVLSVQQKKELRGRVARVGEGSFSAELGDFADCTIFTLLSPETDGLKEWYLKRNLNGGWFESNYLNKEVAITRGTSRKLDNLLVAMEKYRGTFSSEELEAIFSKIETEWKDAKALIEKDDIGVEPSILGESSLAEEGFARAYRLGCLIGSVSECKNSDKLSKRIEDVASQFVPSCAPSMTMLSKIYVDDCQSLIALSPSITFSLNSHLEPIRRDGRNALLALLQSDDEKVRKRFGEVARAALSWIEPTDAWFAVEIVRASEKSKSITIELVACIFNMVARWKAFFEKCCFNHFADENVVRDVVYLGYMMAIMERSQMLNEYRRSAIVNMWETIAKPFQFVEVKEAWRFVGNK